MQKIKNRKTRTETSDHSNNMPSCYFCNSIIKEGEEIISRRDRGFYHRKCFNFLFTLKSNQVRLAEK